ncbi:MAG: SH3 domain-containing protein [Leptolyngbyaceae cyanobacterium RU_5_1]|nr:SH3 domain-containing protein [Leptolyngbyaceae cyanobacterium RU_5_1]
MSWSGLLKVVSGFLVAIALLVGGGYLATQYLIAQFIAPPPKPIFPNDKPSQSTKPTATTQATSAPSPKPSPSASATPSPKPSTSYKARITLGEGLNVREQPTVEANRVGGVEYDEEVTLLEESQDKEWQRVRVESSGLEGWIRSGHTEKISEQDPQN